MIRQDAAAIVVQDEFGIDQRAMILEQPIDTIGSAAFFIRGHRQDDVAARRVTFLLHSNQRRRHDRVSILHVGGAASVKVSFLLDKLKRIGGPVFAPGFNHVEVPD